jgi:hypothetical protein
VLTMTMPRPKEISPRVKSLSPSNCWVHLLAQFSVDEVQVNGVEDASVQITKPPRDHEPTRI